MEPLITLTKGVPDLSDAQVVAACRAVRHDLNDRLALVSRNAALLTGNPALPPHLRIAVEQIVAETKDALKLAEQLLVVACPCSDGTVACD